MAAGNQIIDKFFNLGNKATGGNPVQKAKYDYMLYWMVFLTFIFLAGNYFHTAYTTHSFRSLGWGLVITVFSWFNYWALISFRSAYQNMAKFYGKPKEEVKQETQDDLFSKD